METKDVEYYSKEITKLILKNINDSTVLNYVIIGLERAEISGWNNYIIEKLIYPTVEFYYESYRRLFPLTPTKDLEMLEQVFMISVISKYFRELKMFANDFPLLTYLKN